MKRLSTIIVFLAACFCVMHAQNRRTVTGTVKDGRGDAITGAAVQVSDRPGIGAVTDAEGRWSLEIPDAESSVMLSASCLSYKTQTLPLGKGSTLDFVLEDDADQLEEVVVVGYGSMRRSDLTGSVSSVKIDEQQAAAATTLDNLLQGNAAGVQVLSNGASPDAGVSIRIRGLSSFTSGASDPLFVVDGVIINGSSSAEDLMSHGGLDSSYSDETNGLAGINPQDIAGIEILKDASATAIYGAQGANGVVLITTRTAARERPTILFSTGVDISQRYKRIPTLSFDEYCDFLEASGKTLNHLFEDPATRSGLKYEPVDWQDYMLRTAYNQRWYMSFSGRPKNLTYFFSVGYWSKQGIVRSTGWDQLTLRLNLEQKLGSKLVVGTKSSLGYVHSSLTASANPNRATAAASMMRSMLAYRPYMAEDDEDADPEFEDETFVSSPAKWLSDYQSTRREIRIIPSIYAEWKILPYLSIKSTAGADFRAAENDRWKSRTISPTVGSNGSASVFDQLNWNWDNLLNFNRKIHRLSVSATLGSSTMSSGKYTQIVDGWQIVQDRAHMSSLNGAVPPFTDTRYTGQEYSLQSFFGRAVFNWSERYILTGTWRLDGASKFQGHNKWAQFPSFAFAWRLSEEPWFNVPVVSNAKLRLGWGRVGNQSIAPYKTLRTYTSQNIADHTPGNESMTQIAMYPDIIPNPDLKWETTEQLNAGVDLGLWHGRLSMSADAYIKDTYDLLQTINISRSTGFTVMAVNSGSIRNKGVEFTVNAIPYKRRDVEWEIGGNISFNHGEIVKIGENQSRGTIYLSPDNAVEANYFYGGTLRATSSSTGYLNYFIEGQPLAVFYGFKTDGIAQYDGDGYPEGATGATIKAGDLKYMDLNGNGYIDDDDRTVIGDPNPDFTYGFSTRFIYKGFSLSASFNGSYGNDIFNLNNWEEFRTVVSDVYTQKNIRREAFAGAWTAETGGTFPRLGFDNSERFSDQTVEDGSYLRLANVSLSYDVPIKRKDGFVRGMSIGLSGKNLYVWTKYSGWDPDVNSFGSSINRLGVDMGSYPSARTYSLDLKFNF